MSFETLRKIKKLARGTDVLGRKAVPTVLVALLLAGSPTAAGTLGLDVDVDVDIGHGGVDVDAGVGLGGSGVGVGVGIGLGGGTGVPGAPGVVDPNLPAVASGANGLVCAKDGNETAYNGFVVRDRDGAIVGWVHEATVSNSGKLLAMRIQSTGSGCYKLSNAGFRVSGGEIWANVEAASFR